MIYRQGLLFLWISLCRGMRKGDFVHERQRICSLIGKLQQCLLSTTGRRHRHRKMEGSLISGGTHRRHRVPGCWKWHPSTLQSSTPRRRARRCSFFKRRDLDRVGPGDLGSGLAQPESHVAEDALHWRTPSAAHCLVFSVAGRLEPAPSRRPVRPWVQSASPSAAPFVDLP